MRLKFGLFGGGLAAAVVFVALALTSCSTSPSGSLTVTVAGLPAGAAADVDVTGPGSYSSHVTATTTLSGLAVGSYTVTPHMARASGSIVDTAYSASGGGTVAVADGATATASVTYALQPGSGKLWVADQGAGIDGFSAAQLAASGSPTPSVALANANNPNGLARDATGNLWVGTNAGVVMYGVAQLGSSGTPTPAVTIGTDGTSLASPHTMVFDTSGNLWVGNGNGNLEKFTPAQLAASGTPTPSVVLTGLGSISGLLFDGQGGLWIGSYTATGFVKLSASQLATSGAPTPDVTITDSDGPEGLAFDASGNLWVANIGADTVAMYTAAQIASSGSPTATVTISDDGSNSLTSPVALQFDNAGNLWVSTIGGASDYILKYDAADLAATGSPAPAVKLSGFTNLNWPQMVFNPPTMLP